MEFPATTATTHTLTNGLTVILDADSSAPVISTQAWVKTGSIHEGKFLGAGISHLLEHMVFKGTQSYNSEELSSTVLAAGGQWNAYTTFDRTVYYIDGPALSTETFLKVLLEMTFKPTFPEEEFDKEKDVIRREIEMGQDDPDSRSSRQLFETAFALENRRFPVIGHLELFNLISRQDMIDYHAGRYTTENIFLSISGDFDKTALLVQLEEMTADIPRTLTTPVTPSTEPPQQGVRHATSSFAIPTSKFTMAWQAPSLDHPDSAALDVLSTILGGGHSSRLYKNIREKKELCHYISAWSYLPAHMPGMFAVSAEVDPDKQDELKQAILDEIHTLLGDQLDRELAKAKRMTLSNQFKTLTSASGRASDLASNWNEAHNLDFTRDYLAKVDSLSISDIRGVAEAYLTDHDSLTISIINPEVESDEDSAEKTESKEREIQEHVLSNGLKLFLCPDHRTPTVSFQGAVLTGLPSESIGSQGVNTLLASLITKGTDSRSAEEIADTVESLGASINASSGNNTALIGASCLSPDTETIMEILADCLTAPSFNNDAIEREKKLLINAIQESEMDPASLAFKKLRAALFGDSGYGLNALGTEESVNNLFRLSLVAHHKAYFNASNTTLSIFGDIDTKQVIELAEKHLSKIPTGKRAEVVTQELLEPTTHNFTLDKQQAVLAIGYPGSSVQDDDRFALALLHAWCSDMAGPLFSRIREELGLAYYCSSTMFNGHTTGFFGFYMGTSPAQLDQATEELQKTIQAIATAGMDNTTLKNVKTSWLAKQALANQSNGAMARLCSIDTLLGLGPLHHRETTDRILALTTDDIKRVAKRFFADQEPTIVTVKP